METHGKQMPVELRKSFAEKFNKMRKESVLTDVILTCKGKRFEAHRSYLSAFSAYFRNMFTFGFQEAEEGKVDFPTLQPHTLETILEIIYTAELKELTFEEMKEILLATHQLQFCDIYSHYRNVIMSRLSQQNLYVIWDIAVLLQDEELLKAVYDKLAISYWTTDLQLISENKMKNYVLYHVNKKISCHDSLLKILVLWAFGEDGDRLESFKKFCCFIDPEKITNGMISKMLKTTIPPLSLLKNILFIHFNTLQFNWDLQSLNAINFSMMLLGQDDEKNWYIQHCRLGQWDTQILLPGRAIEDASITYYNNHLKVFTKERNAENSLIYLHVLNSKGKLNGQRELQVIPNAAKIALCARKKRFMACIYDERSHFDYFFKLNRHSVQKYGSTYNVQRIQLLFGDGHFFHVTQLNETDKGPSLVIWKYAFSTNVWYSILKVFCTLPSSIWNAFLKFPNIIIHFFPGGTMYIDTVTKQYEFREENNNVYDVVSADVSQNVAVCLTSEGLLYIKDISKPNSDWKCSNRVPTDLKSYNQVVLQKY